MRKTALTMFFLAFPFAILFSMLATADAQAGQRASAAEIRAALRTTPPRTQGTRRYRAWVICAVWRKRGNVTNRTCRTAVHLASCEGGLSPWAKNGQYLGMFQVSSALQRDYLGFKWGNGWAQARHSLRVFIASGRNFRVHWRWSAACWA